MVTAYKFPPAYLFFIAIVLDYISASLWQVISHLMMTFQNQSFWTYDSILYQKCIKEEQEERERERDDQVEWKLLSI